MPWRGNGFQPLMIGMVLICSGCAGPKPILHTNPQSQQAGQQQIEADIDLCRDRAEEAGASERSGKVAQVGTGTAVGAGVGAASGAVGGAITGSAGIGAAVGAVSGAMWGFLSGLFTSGPAQPSQTYVNFVNRCLEEKGYEVAGWQ